MKLGATIDTRAASRRRWDAVVVGAGPAGAAVARRLARRGRSVLLVDRQLFPRDKVCGGCLSARTLRRLEDLDLGAVVPRLRGIPLVRLKLGGWGNGGDLPLPGGASVSRRAFDAALVVAAVESGADFLPGCAATLRPAAGGLRCVGLSTGGGDIETTASIVVMAGGLRGVPLSRKKEARRPAAAARIGASAIVDEGPPEYRPGTIYMAVGAGGYVGIVRLEDGRLNVAAALDGSVVRREGPGSPVSRVLAAAGFEPIRGLAASAWAGTPGLWFTPRHVAAERVFVVGDAAGYVEPFTGEGVGWALESAALVEPVAIRAMEEWSASMVGEWTARYRDAIRVSQRPCKVIAGVLRRPWASRLLLAALSVRPALGGPVVRRLHGEPAQGAEQWL